MTAKEWLLAHDYTQFADGTWSAGGYEADVQYVLQEYMDEVSKVLNALPLHAFGDDMGQHDAADFVDHASEFFEAMQLAKEALR